MIDTEMNEDGEFIPVVNHTKRNIIILVGVLLFLFVIVLFNINLPNKAITQRLNEINVNILVEQNKLDEEIIKINNLIEEKNNLDKVDTLFKENEAVLNVKIEFSLARLKVIKDKLDRLVKSKIVFYNVNK